MIIMADRTDVPEDAKPLPDVARELGIPVPTLRYWVNQGFINHWELRGHWKYVSVSEVRSYNTFAPGGTSGPLGPTDSPDSE